MAPKAHVVWLLPPFFFHHPLLCPSSTVLQPHWSSYRTSHDSHMLTQDLPTCYAISSGSNTVSSERTPSAIPYKDFPFSPGTLYPFFFFFITLITTTWFLFNCHFPSSPWECKLQKSYSLWPSQEEKFISEVQEASKCPSTAFQVGFKPPTPLQAAMLPDFAQTISLPLMSRTE